MLDQKDLEQIGKIVAGTEERLGKALLATEDRFGKALLATEDRFGKALLATEDRFGKALLATEDRLGNVIDEKIKASEGRVIVAVGEMLEQQVLPQIGELGDKSDALKKQVDALAGKVDTLEGTVANLPNKAYLDDKFADHNGDFVRRDKQTNKKIDSTVELLQVKGVFTKDEAQHIQQKFQVFPAA